ncbi:MAG TPA: IreB family regulatory phosphoprotein [Clostridiales bacterium]|nr:IreB family regulatory phosphoprotein [Clostridiales bacterium]
MGNKLQETMKFKFEKEKSNKARDILIDVYKALEEKGYDPINQIVGYFISGDPTYITSYKDARYLVRKLERDELLEELVRYYIQKNIDSKK